MTKKYRKGEPLDTKEKFIKWIAQELPYFWGDGDMPLVTIDNCINSYWDVDGYIEIGEVFQAIPVEEKKLYAYKGQETGLVFFALDEFVGVWDFNHSTYIRDKSYDLVFNSEGSDGE